MVPEHDVAERVYCQTCAFSKVMYDNRTLSEEIDV
jgi:hypothetical protein